MSKISFKDLVRKVAGNEPRPVTYEFHERKFTGPVADRIAAPADVMEMEGGGFIMRFENDTTMQQE